MQPSHDSLPSSSPCDLWSVDSLDELSDDVLTVSGPVGFDDDDDDDDAEADEVRRRSDNQAGQSPTKSPPRPTTTRPVKTKTSRSVVRRNERERNRVKQVTHLLFTEETGGKKLMN